MAQIHWATFLFVCVISFRDGGNYCCSATPHPRLSPAVPPFERNHRYAADDTRNICASTCKKNGGSQNWSLKCTCWISTSKRLRKSASLKQGWMLECTSWCSTTNCSLEILEIPPQKTTLGMLKFYLSTVLVCTIGSSKKKKKGQAVLVFIKIYKYRLQICLCKEERAGNVFLSKCFFSCADNSLLTLR